jgi:hypothetical protein
MSKAGVHTPGRVRHATALAVGLGSLIVMGGFTAPGSVAATAPTPTWTLVDLHDHRCDQLGGGGSPGSYAVEISGRWSHALSIGMDALPAGVTATPLQAPIPAGTSDGAHELAYVRVDVARRQATPGTYTMQLWASDGTTREQVPVTLVIQTTRCVAY